MPRSRNIKPSFFTNDELAECEPLARLLFIGLWTIADYKGCIEWRPRKIKAQILPYDNCDIEKLMINLDKSRFIISYSDGVKLYIKIRKFARHQHPHPNEIKKGSSIPDCTEEMMQLVDSNTLMINHDKSRLITDDSITNPSDSCILIPDSCSPIIPFDDFYLNYPKKTTKAEAMDYWNKKMSNQDRQLAIDGIQNHVSGKEKKFIKDPVRYLKHRRWEDEAISYEENKQYNQSAKNQKLQESNQSIYERASQLEREASEEERSGLSEIMGHFANALPEPKL